MGISDGGGGGEGGSVLDCSVGSIVWVRRRNGSWWPGRILGPEELSASHLMSPRSGTPVKLLGREDASVDWYNLEKSKRVKVFRCGEFDACIERAEASQGIPIKKREKYARREDAILHALQLEREQLEMKHQKLGTFSNGTGHRNSGAHRRELHSFSSDIYVRDDKPKVHSKYASHESHTFSRKAEFSGEEDNKGNTLYVHKGKTSKQSGWEEYNNESLPRMRGLQDFGLRIAPPKKKVSQSVTCEASHKPLDIHVDPLSSVGHTMDDENYTDSSKSSFAIKRKRSQSGNGEVSLIRKRDRRRPLVQVLQSSAKLPVSHPLQPEYHSDDIPMQGERDHVGVICQAKRSRCLYVPVDSNDSLDDNGYPSEEMPGTDTQLRIVNSHSLDYSVSLAEEYSSSGLAEETESDSSETDYLEPDPEEDGNLTDTTQTLVPGSKDCDPPVLQVSENFRDLNSDEVPLLGYIPLLQDRMMDGSADGGVSKWHMKGKRNIRNLTKRPTDLMDGKISSNGDRCNGPSKGTPHESMGSSFKMRRTNSSGQRTGGQNFYHKKGSSHFAHDGVDMIGKDLGHKQLMSYGNRIYSFALQGPRDHGRSHSSFNDSDDDSHLPSPTSWRADGPSCHMARRTYWEDSDDGFDPDYADCPGGEMEPMLIDVDIQVQKRSYKGEHVPWVSLSSKWNGGKPILGHPVQIEILEDGSTSHLVSRYDFGPEENSIPPAFRRTAKRTVMHRIPRPNPASALEEDADLLDSDQEIKPSPKKMYTGFSNHEAKFTKKSSSHARRPTMLGKLQKKLVKKFSTSSQKTRTLSSLATEQRLGGDGGSAKHSRRSVILDGLIKPEGGIRLVTCVPVKVVFSRIMEAVGRPSSGSVHRARLASPAVRGLS